MKIPPVEHLPELNCLLIRLDGPLTPAGFIDVYNGVLKHEKFRKDMHLIWNASSASLQGITMKDVKRVFDCVKKSEAIRGRSCSAWVFSRGQNYESACLFNAAFGSNIKIRYEIFDSIHEASEWIRNVKLYGFQHHTII
ncbi:hypothetical protein [Pelagicoccus albus]|uniref:SpoIIAA-like n=1 Tax=Pelagicoccus albus TaxID=415222 RepID=A0A7X1B422_9BACT|nr:hypothetical protein [Pelagicoccus albus]MBC2605162.1 hypothetical protein [Pelagicoccus albus]